MSYDTFYFLLDLSFDAIIIAQLLFRLYYNFLTASHLCLSCKKVSVIFLKVVIPFEMQNCAWLGLNLQLYITRHDHYKLVPLKKIIKPIIHYCNNITILLLILLFFIRIFINY